MANVAFWFKKEEDEFISVADQFAYPLITVKIDHITAGTIWQESNAFKTTQRIIICYFSSFFVYFQKYASMHLVKVMFLQYVVFLKVRLLFFSFQFLNPSTYALYRIVVLVGDLTIVLFWSRFCIYSCVVGDRLSWDRSAVPLSSSWEKVVNVSLSTRKRRGSTVNGVPSAWLRCFALRSAINWSINPLGSLWQIDHKVVDLLKWFYISRDVRIMTTSSRSLKWVRIILNLNMKIVFFK